MKRNSILFGMLLGCLTMTAGYPDGYYNSLDGKKGAELMNAVKTVARKGAKTISYGDATWDAFKSTDVRVVNGKQYWWDMYSDNNVSINGHDGLNIEHSVANSWWGHTKNEAYKDIVHLNPSNANANNRKSNYPLGEIGQGTWDNGVTFIGKPVSGQGGGSTYVYEPHDMYKGDFARAFMYMFTAYKDISWASNTNWMYDTSSELMLKPWAYQLLLKWAANDPVSEKEVNRNDGIYKEQKNRNPFIDLPDLGEYIWGSKRGEVFYVDNSQNPDPTPDPDPNPNPNPDPDPVTPSDGEWNLVTSVSQLENGALYVILDETHTAAMSYTLSKTYMSVTGSVPKVNNGTIPNLVSDIAVVRLNGSGASYTMYVQDADGNGKGYLVSESAKSVSLASAGGTSVKFTISSDGTASLSFGSAGELQYNASSPRFTTYTSSQKKLHLFKYKPAENPVDPPYELSAPGLYALDQDGKDIYDGDSFSKMCLVELSYTGENADAYIYYTIDGTDPKVDATGATPATLTSSTLLYTAPLEFTTTTTVKAVGVKKNSVSPMATATYKYDATSGVERVDDSCLVEVWGNNILVPEGAVIYDLNGRMVNGENLASGIYIVRSRNFKEPVKVLVK